MKGFCRSGAALLLIWLAACGTPQNGQSPLQQFAGGHAGAVLSVAFVPGGDLALSSGTDDTAKIWDLRSDRVLKEFKGPRFRFQSVAVSSDGHHALTPARDKSLHWWALDSGQEEKTLTGAAADLTNVALDAGNATAAGAGGDGTIHVWDIASIRQLWVSGTDGAVVRIGFLGDANSLRWIQRDGSICRWGDRATHCTTSISEPVSAGAFSASGDQALVASSYGTLVVCDIAAGKVIRTLPGATADIVAVAFSPNGERAISGGADKKVRLWNLQTGSQIAEISVDAGYISSLAFSPDGKMALFGTDKGTVTAWNLK